MYIIVLLTTVHVVVCLFLIIVVLLQSGKAADLAGAFGGMGSQTAFGPRGSATLLSKATTISAIVFMITSMALSVVATRGEGGAKTVLDSAGSTQSAPAKPAQVPARPGAPAVPPSVTLTPEGGQSKTIPLQVPSAPAGQKPPVPKK
jgi:preprotein translocase subunit SecG